MVVTPDTLTATIETLKPSIIPYKHIFHLGSFGKWRRSYSMLTVDQSTILNVTPGIDGILIDSPSSLGNYKYPFYFEGRTDKSNGSIHFSATIGGSNGNPAFTATELMHFLSEYTTAANKISVSPLNISSRGVGNRADTFELTAIFDEKGNLNVETKGDVKADRSLNITDYEKIVLFLRNLSAELNDKIPEDILINEQIFHREFYQKLCEGQIPGIRGTRAGSLLRVAGGCVSRIYGTLEELVSLGSSNETNLYQEAHKRKETQAQIALTLAGRFLRDHPDFLNKKLSQPTQT